MIHNVPCTPPKEQGQAPNHQEAYHELPHSVRKMKRETQGGVILTLTATASRLPVPGLGAMTATAVNLSCGLLAD